MPVPIALPKHSTYPADFACSLHTQSNIDVEKILIRFKSYYNELKCINMSMIVLIRSLTVC